MWCVCWVAVFRSHSYRAGALLGNRRSFRLVSFMASHIVHCFLYQSLRPRLQPDQQVLWPPSELLLMSDGTVSFGGGPYHGAWSISGTILVVTFNWRGAQDRAIEHWFIAIATTSTFVLTHANGNIRTDAVLVPAGVAATASAQKRSRCE